MSTSRTTITITTHEGGDGSPVRGVLLVTTLLALVLILGASYASIQSASRELSEKLAALPSGPVQGVSLLDVPQDETRSAAEIAANAALSGDPNQAAAAIAAAQELNDADAVASLMTHGRVDGMHASPRMTPLPEGTVPIDYTTLHLPEYRSRTSSDGIARPNDEVFTPEVLALDGKQIAMLGFQVPVEIDAKNRKLKSFVLSPMPPGCHFGTLPRPDEWIDVDAVPMGGTDYLAYRIVRVTGTLEVGEVYDEFGFLMNIYRIRATAVEQLR